MCGMVCKYQELTIYIYKQPKNLKRMEVPTYIKAHAIYGDIYRAPYWDTSGVIGISSELSHILQV